MTDTRKCPPLGMGSVDFGALHEADARGRDLNEALAKATTTPKATSPAPAKPAGKTPHRGA
jgi:hypothetical protein